MRNMSAKRSYYFSMKVLELFFWSSSLKSCCPWESEVTWLGAMARLKRIPFIPENILPQTKACVGGLPFPLALPSSLSLLLGTRPQAWHGLADQDAYISLKAWRISPSYPSYRTAVLYTFVLWLVFFFLLYFKQNPCLNPQSEPQPYLTYRDVKHAI